MRVLVADASADIRGGVTDRLKAEGFERIAEAANVDEAIRKLSEGLASRQAVDMVLLGLDLPDRAGLEGLSEILGVFDVLLLLLADRTQRPMAIEGLSKGAVDYLLRPLDYDLLLLKIEKQLTRRFMQRELRRSTARNETLFLNVLAVMAKVLEAKDPYTRFHSEKVSTLAASIAREYGFADDEVRRIGIAGILHDLGKMGVKEAILKKPGPLDPEERTAVQRHPVIAATILEPIEQLQSAIGFIKYHHEHYDGTGYPEGRRGEEIPLGARIIHCAEAFDAMVSRRSYSTPRTGEQALEELKRCAGGQFDPECVKVLEVVLRKSGQLSLPSDKGASGRNLAQLLEDLTGTISTEDSNPRNSGLKDAVEEGPEGEAPASDAVSG